MQFGCCHRWMECLMMLECVQPEGTFGDDVCAMRRRVEDPLAAVKLADEQSAWYKRILELTTPTSGSIRFGVFDARPHIVYMLEGPVPIFYRVGPVYDKKGKPAKSSVVKKFAKQCQGAYESIVEMDKSMRPKTMPDALQWLKAMLGVEE